jgi:hypothetical protein
VIVLPRDAQVRLALAAAMRGHRVAVPGRLYADVDGELLLAVRRDFVLRADRDRPVGGGEFVPAIFLASAELNANPYVTRSIRCAGHDEWSLTPVEARA